MAEISKFQRVRNFVVDNVVEHPLFEFMIFLIISANTVILLMDRYPQQSEEQDLLEDINKVFYYVFVGELILKVFAYGFIGYVKDYANLLDAIVVIVGTISIIIEELNKGQELTGGVEANESIRAVRIVRTFRTLRVLRVFKMSRVFVKL